MVDRVGMMAFWSPSVFNFYLPEYKPLGAVQDAGLVSPEGLAEKRKIAIVIAFVAAAILTPPDVVSQLLLALPIIALYEISIIGARIVAPKDLNEAAD